MLHLKNSSISFCIRLMLSLLMVVFLLSSTKGEGIPSTRIPSWGKAISYAPEGKGLITKLGTKLSTLRWGGELNGDFTIGVWLKADRENLKMVEEGEKQVAVWELRGDKTKARLVIQLRRGGIFELVLASGKARPQAWRAINPPVIADEWIYLVLTRDKSGIALFCNGARVLDVSGTLMRGWDAFTLGWAGSRPPWLGEGTNPYIFEKCISENEIRKECDSAGLPIPSVTTSMMPPAPSSNVSASQDFSGRYPTLRVVPNGDHPLIDQLHIAATVVSWSSPTAVDLLLKTRNRNPLGTRLALYSQVARDANNLPIYNSGVAVQGLQGKEHFAVRRKNMKGEWVQDIFAMGEDTAFGAKCLVWYENIGTPSAPKFANVEPVWMNGRPLVDALRKRLCAWYVGDIDGDSIPDILVAVQIASSSYWPDGKGPIWNGVDRPGVGKGQGYNAKGEWLGGKLTTELWWAKGSLSRSGSLSFGKPQTVYDRHADTPSRWQSWGADRALAVLHSENQMWIIQSGSIDRILAFPAQWIDGKLICQEAQPLLAGEDTVLKDTYFPVKLNVVDIDKDGQPELLVDGNPGRLVVLKGSRVGEFQEVSSLLMRGGPVVADTLTTPVRIEWTGDGYPDLITGDASGRLLLWPGTALPHMYQPPLEMTVDGNPVRHQAGETWGSIQGPTERRWGYLQPTAGDWMGDGTLSIITNDILGKIMLYKRGVGNTELLKPETVTKNGKPLPTGWRSRPDILPASANFGNEQKPVLLHLDWDGDLAIAIPKTAGSTEIERVEKLRYESGKPVRLCGGGGLWGRTKLNIVDWNGDGKWDVVFGTNGHAHRFFMTIPGGSKASMPILLENVGTSEAPVFKKPRPIKLINGSLIDLGAHNASVWATDLDNDGRPDLIVGAEDGKIYYFLKSELTD